MAQSIFSQPGQVGTPMGGTAPVTPPASAPVQPTTTPAPITGVVLTPLPVETLTPEQFGRVLPKQVKNKLTQEMMDNINDLLSDQELRENYRDNLLSFTSVMSDGRFKLQDYINAVRYVSHKLLGSSNIVAYAKTFPDRYQRLLDEGADDKTISSYTTAYNKNILVNKILEQTLVPVHVLNADLYQKAINAQALLMTTANSEKVRCDAADSLLQHLKRPEGIKIELDVNHKQDKVIDDLRATTQALVAQQRALLESGGMTAREMAHSKLIVTGNDDITDGELIDAVPEDEP